MYALRCPLYLISGCDIIITFPFGFHGNKRKTYRQKNGSPVRLFVLIVMVSVDIFASSVQLGKLYRLSCMQQTIVIFKRVNKIAKATISFFMSVCLSGGMEQLGSHWTDFHEI